MHRLALGTVVSALMLMLMLSSSACDRDGSKTKATPTAEGASSQPTGSAAVLLRGTWRAEEFIGATPAGSASVAAFNDALKSGLAPAVLVTYTGDQVKIQTPGSAMLSSSYEVKEDAPRRVVLLNGKDTVVIAFLDEDHMIIDRPGNPFNSKMKMVRVKDAAPATSPSK